MNVELFSFLFVVVLNGCGPHGRDGVAVDGGWNDLTFKPALTKQSTQEQRSFCWFNAKAK